MTRYRGTDGPGKPSEAPLAPEQGSSAPESVPTPQTGADGRLFVTLDCLQGRHGDCWDATGLSCECPTCYSDRQEMFARWEAAAHRTGTHRRQD